MDKLQQVIVHKGRTVVLPVSVGYDVSNDTITSQIRVGKTQASDLIATWTVTHLTDGTDGELILTLDNSVTGAVEKAVGYMDMKRMVAGEPVPVFDDPIEVLFKDTVTA